MENAIKAELAFVLDIGGDIQKKFILNMGITKESKETLETTKLNINIGGEIIQHKMELVTLDLPIQPDGIIGRDFLQRSACNISYQTYALTINTKNKQMIIAIYYPNINKRCTVTIYLRDNTNRYNNTKRVVVVLNK